MAAPCFVRRRSAVTMALIVALVTTTTTRTTTAAVAFAAETIDSDATIRHRDVHSVTAKKRSVGEASAAIAGRIVNGADRVDRLLLNGGVKTAFPRASDGAFHFADLSPGKYSIEVVSHELIFGTYKVLVKADGSVDVIEYPYLGAPRLPASHPIEVIPRGYVHYFLPREGFNVFSLIRNPTVLMMGFMLLMTVCMPRMMNNMDPEMMEEMQKQQQMLGGGDLSQMLKNALSGGVEQQQTGANRAAEGRVADRVDEGAAPRQRRRGKQQRR